MAINVVVPLVLLGLVYGMANHGHSLSTVSVTGGTGKGQRGSGKFESRYQMEFDDSHVFNGLGTHVSLHSIAQPVSLPAGAGKTTSWMEYLVEGVA